MNFMRLFGSRKGSYFFVLDAFIAGIILVSSLAIFFSVFTVADNPSQNYAIAEDFVVFLESTTLERYSGELIYDYYSTGVIDDLSPSLLDQIVLFYDDYATGVDLDDLDRLNNLLAEVSVLAPENSGISFHIAQGATPADLYSANLPEGGADSSRVRLSSQRVVFLPDSSKVYVFEVRIWQ